MGAFLGDSLGNPHEFRVNANVPYTGKLEHRAFMISQFQGKKELEVGQCSDDSEMTLALLRTIIQDQGYNREHVIMAYLKWANSGGWMLGKNTRALLKGVTTMKGYQGRIAKILTIPMSERTQSNGALMRCSPLALIFDNTSVIQDVDITNPNPVCEDCNLIYVSSLRLALQGYNGAAIFSIVKGLAQTNEVKGVLDQVEKRELRNISENKGWCLHGLWCALIVITSNMSYSESMRWIITQKGSDTDTNACIAGALLGAKLGFDAINQEPDTAQNIQILLNCNTASGPTPRPLEYSPHDFHELTEAAHRLTNS
ncbi:ADP-ribosylglycohydrolase [uncultured virus]|nr:ADP-ribosylglycohydrolase [uncultured virus]